MRKFNIYKRKDGRYEGRLLRGRRNNGQRKYLYFFGKTREAVERKMALVMNVKKTDDTCTVTVAEVFEEWYQSIHNRIKESSIKDPQRRTTV